MNKQNAVYPYNGILFSSKKRLTTDTWYNMDELWKHYAMVKKPDSQIPCSGEVFYLTTDFSFHLSLQHGNYFFVLYVVF